jgi:hypothetical protein
MLYCLDLTVDSNDITVFVSGEQNHYFHLWGLQKTTRDFFPSPLVKTMFFTILPLHCTVILQNHEARHLTAETRYGPGEQLFTSPYFVAFYREIVAAVSYIFYKSDHRFFQYCNKDVFNSMLGLSNLLSSKSLRNMAIKHGETSLHH